MNLPKWALWTLIGIMALTFILYLRGCKQPGLPIVKIEKETNTVTDTFIKKVYVADTNYKAQLTAANVRIEYLDSLKTNLQDSLIYLNDSIQILVTSKGRVEVKTKYIPEFIREPKIIAGKFTLDSLQLDLLNINGAITTERYETDYDHYGYLYTQQSGIKRFDKPRPDIKTLKPRTFNFTGGAFLGYDPFRREALLSTQYFLTIKNRVGLGAQINLTFLQDTRISPFIGLQYKIR